MVTVESTCNELNIYSVKCFLKSSKNPKAPVANSIAKDVKTKNQVLLGINAAETNKYV